MTVHSVRGLRAFRHRNYQLFFGGQLVSLIGTWMQQVAQAWLVLELTNDALWLGLVAAAQFVPVMVFGLFGGVLADALPKRQTIFVVQAVMMVLAAMLAVLTLTGVVEVWMIIVLALLLGTANAIDMPVRQSFVVEIVGRGDIGNAVALNSAMFNAARVVGPAVAGLTIGAFGSGTAFAINAASFAAVLVALAAMDPTALRTPELPPRPRSAPQVIEQLREGIAYVRHTPPVLLAIVIIGLVGTFGMNFSVVIPALARDVLGTDAAGYGFLMTASGVGSLIAANGWWRHRPRTGRSPARRLEPVFRVGPADGDRRVRGHHDGCDRQHDDPAQRPGRPPWSRDEFLYDRLRGLHARRRSPVRLARLGGRRRPGSRRRGDRRGRGRARRLAVGARPNRVRPSP
jgi:MFS family permease